MLLLLPSSSIFLRVMATTTHLRIAQDLYTTIDTLSPLMCSSVYVSSASFIVRTMNRKLLLLRCNTMMLIRCVLAILMRIIARSCNHIPQAVQAATRDHNCTMQVTVMSIAIQDVAGGFESAKSSTQPMSNLLKVFFFEKQKGRKMYHGSYSSAFSQLQPLKLQRQH